MYSKRGVVFFSSLGRWRELAHQQSHVMLLSYPFISGAQAANLNFSPGGESPDSFPSSCPVGKERHLPGEAGRNEPFPQIAKILV